MQNKTFSRSAKSVILTVTICITLTGIALGQDHESGFETLFDGSSMDHWRGYQNEEIGAGWKIDGDALMFDGSGGGDIVTKKDYANFDFRFEWKVNPAANSGIMYRVSMGDGAPYLSGPEYQILDDSKHKDGNNPTTSAAALYALYAADGKELKPVGEWNTGRIVLDGNHVEHWVNGKKVVESEIGGDEWNELVAASKFKDWGKFGKNSTGRIALQDHGDQVWFRNIRIKELTH